MKAIWNDTVLAQSDHTEVVEGNQYFPPDSIVGERYVVVDGETLDDAIVANEPQPEPAKT